MTIRDERGLEPIKQLQFTDDRTGREYQFPSEFTPDPYGVNDTEVTLHSHDGELWVKISFGVEEKDK